MINIEKRPICKTEVFTHNGTHVIYEAWEDEMELTAYPFSCTLTIDHIQQIMSHSVTWPVLKPMNREMIELDIEKEMKKIYVNPK